MVLPTTLLLVDAVIPRKTGETVGILMVPYAVRYPARNIVRLIFPVIVVEVGLTISIVTELLVRE